MGQSMSYAMLVFLKVDGVEVGYSKIVYKSRNPYSDVGFQGFLNRQGLGNQPTTYRAFKVGACKPAENAAVVDHPDEIKAGRIDVGLSAVVAVGQRDVYSAIPARITNEAINKKLPEGKKWFLAPGLKAEAGSVQSRTESWSFTKYQEVLKLPSAQLRYDSHEALLLRKVLNPNIAEHRAILRTCKDPRIAAMGSPGQEPHNQPRQQPAGRQQAGAGSSRNGQTGAAVKHEGIAGVKRELGADEESMPRSATAETVDLTGVIYLRVDGMDVGYGKIAHRSHGNVLRNFFDGFLSKTGSGNQPTTFRAFKVGACKPAENAAVVDHPDEIKAGRIDVDLSEVVVAVGKMDVYCGNLPHITNEAVNKKLPEGKKWFLAPGLKAEAGSVQSRTESWSFTKYQEVLKLPSAQLRYDSHEALLLRKVLNPNIAEHRAILQTCKDPRIAALGSPRQEPHNQPRQQPAGRQQAGAGSSTNGQTGAAVKHEGIAGVKRELGADEESMPRSATAETVDLTGVNSRSLSAKDAPKNTWLDAWADPVAGLKAFSNCIHTCNLYGDGDWRLIVADADRKIKVWKGTVKASEHTLLDDPVAITSFMADRSQPRVPTLAVAAGANIYMFKNLRPYYKFTLPDSNANAEEDVVW
eukprot:gene3766-4025_t